MPVSTVAVAVAVAVTVTVTVEPDYQGSSAFISMVRKTLGHTPQRYLRREGCRKCFRAGVVARVVVTRWPDDPAVDAPANGLLTAMAAPGGRVYRHAPPD